METELSRFFLPAPQRSPFNTQEQELDAVVSGAKGIAMYVYSYDPEESEDYIEMLSDCLSRQLSVSVVPITYNEQIDSLKQFYLFIYRPEQVWRVRAYCEFAAVARVWTDRGDALEAVQSSLLGYNQEQIYRWVRSQHDRRAAWAGRTIYVLLDSAQKDAMRPLGMRCIDPTSCSQSPVLAFYAYGDVILDSRIVESLPSGTHLARVSIRPDAFERLLPRPRTGESLVSSKLFYDDIVILNNGLCSPLQFMEVSGWPT